MSSGTDAASYGIPAHFRSDKSVWAAFVAEEAPLSATSKEPAIAALLKRMQLIHRAAEAAGRVDPLMRNMKQLRAIGRYIAPAPPFSDMAEGQMVQLARAAVLVRTQAGERVVAEGKVGSAVFFVLSGEFSVFQQSASSSPFGMCVLMPAVAMRLHPLSR